MPLNVSQLHWALVAATYAAWQSGTEVISIALNTVMDIIGFSITAQ
jgi:hypothetical protein